MVYEITEIGEKQEQFSDLQKSIPGCWEHGI